MVCVRTKLLTIFCLHGKKKKVEPQLLTPTGSLHWLMESGWPSSGTTATSWGKR